MSGYQVPHYPACNASDLLEIINPDRGTFTCVGDAPSCGRRCRNPIAKHNRAAANNILTHLADIVQDRVVLRLQLQELAERSLCQRYHQDQAAEKARQWYKSIVKEVQKTKSRPSSSGNTSRGRTLSSYEGSEKLVLHTITSRPSAEAVTKTQVGVDKTAKRNRDLSIESDCTASKSEESSCPVCYNAFVEIRQTPCGHKFCRSCISTWLTESKGTYCPMDRKPLQMTDLMSVG